ncbi:ABC transporter substrate-binding protein [Paenibacillus thiaminolyticus]|uniref:ABC transporter substrate-binding protein n=1 Tax=Paenibacillus thiaminolyticus TaxID=49283 RepID=A0AAP9DR31_PANTH|nr:ABC transporter substrate-binding protein [Paenibacillus thiaminolyticus]MCY9537223.1 ABC transporter substrate-binding protein [Paenibacillus thiaminolyticus]MCY9600610.1 ABC transporter substrate-binding protein [Paenibacillus thiaminolyticus]MCY9608376.1 ABC transporter substrate-binding protein [Paenibacillus thiaminolyticus]MCY9614785.1 ABC transporter substrate-binding protein [Paenibacillus thiaminolyticus]MCY9619923.1 ABC transporter substrate-binding protein [Paenibacillus thiamino
MRFRTASYFILLVTAFLLLAGCRSANTSSATEAAETPQLSSSAQQPSIRIGWQDSGYPSPFAFKPSGPGGFLRNSFLFDTLTWKDDTGIIPWLAASWKVSEDGLRYTFTLERDVKWHDGTALSADDVVFTFEYFKTHSFPWTGDLSQIQSVTRTGDGTVEFQLNNKYAPFLTDLAGIVPIIPKHVWEKVSDPIAYRDPSALIGTGPFTLKQYDEKSGQYWFTANESYFKGSVNVKDVAYIDVKNKVLSLQKNEINAASTLSYQEAEQLQKEGFQMMKSEPTGSAVRIVFNLDHPQLQDKRLRQALAYALDRADMAGKIAGGTPIPGSGGIIPPDSPWYNGKVKTYEYSTAKAEQMLDELGYRKDGTGVRQDLKLSVIVSSTSKEAQMMKEMLKKVGIELNIQQVDGVTFTSAMGENKYDMALTGHIGLSGDPDFLRLWFLGKASNSFAARGSSFDHPQFQQLAQEQLQELDSAARKQIVGEMQLILSEELPTLVLYHRPFYFLYKEAEFDRWFNTYGGIADGIPLWDNKAAFIDAKKK